MFDSKLFGNSIRRLREQQNLTIYELAHVLDIHYTTLDKYELGSRKPTVSAIIKLANHFSVSVSSLLQDSLDTQKEHSINELKRLITPLGDGDIDFLHQLLLRL